MIRNPFNLACWFSLLPSVICLSAPVLVPAPPLPPPTHIAEPAQLAPAAVEQNPAPTGNNLVLNFQGASLADVLNYLSESAGFVIVQEVPVTGNVNIISRQPVSPEEAVDLLNTVLLTKGYTAIRNGRILKIISRKDAEKRDLPVVLGSDPSKIPRKDEVVTQILPLRFGEATKLVENLRPLLAENATISANEASNAIIMTDTQTNIRRIAQIVSALDTSVASISTIRVFPLKFADAKQVAELMTDLFTKSKTQNNNLQNQRGGFPFGGPGGGRGQGNTPATPQSEREIKGIVTAVADVPSNSVVVSAPEGTMEEIQEIITQIDTSVNDVSGTRIFKLRHADAVETANIINALYSDTTGSSTQNRAQTGNNQRGQNNGQPQAGAGARTDRSLLQAKVVAVGDPRTNSLLVTASQDTMAKLVDLIVRLDATESKKQRVYVHSLQHADAENVASVLRGMLGQQTTGAASQNSTSALMQRTSNGAALNAQDVLNTNSSGPAGS